MDFRLNDDDRAMLELCEEVGKKVVAPWADRAEAGEHPAEAIEGLARAGLVGMVAPEEYGGPGAAICSCRWLWRRWPSTAPPSPSI